LLVEERGKRKRFRELQCLNLAEMAEGEILKKEKGGLTASFFFLVGVIRLERTTIPTQVGMR